MESVTLKQLVQMCIDNKVNFRALVANAQQTLVDSKLQLSAKDLEELRQLVKDEMANRDFEAYCNLIKKYAGKPQQYLW